MLPSIPTNRTLSQCKFTDCKLGDQLDHPIYGVYTVDHITSDPGGPSLIRLINLHGREVWFYASEFDLQRFTLIPPPAVKTRLKPPPMSAVGNVG